MDVSAHTHQLPVPGERASDTPARQRFDRVLYVVLWLCLLVMVAIVAYVKLRVALMDGLLIDWMSLVIRLVLLGCICWIVETFIEMRLMPWRFIDSDVAGR
jgi:hypothetical protein